MTFENDRLTGAIDFRNEKSNAATNEYLRQMHEIGSIVVVCADIVGLSSINQDLGYEFANGLIATIGEQLDFTPEDFSGTFSDTISSIAARSSRGTSDSPGQSDKRPLDLWGRLGGDEILGFLALPSDSVTTPEEVADTVIGRLERRVAFAIQEAPKLRKELFYRGFPLRFGYSHTKEIQLFDSIISPSDAAVSIAKIIGKINHDHTYRDQGLRVGHTSTTKESGVTVDTGILKRIRISPDIEHHVASPPETVSRFRLDRDGDKSPFTEFICVGDPSRRSNIHLGMTYLSPYTRRMLPGTDFVTLDDYNTRTARKVSGIQAPTREEVTSLVEELVKQRL